MVKTMKLRNLIYMLAITSASSLGLWFFGVNASSLTFDLNCAKSTSGNTCDTFTPAISWGTLTISDNATNASLVDITIDLVPIGSAGGQKVLDFYLNFADGIFPLGGVFSASGDATSVTYNPNGLDGGAGPNLGFFDLTSFPNVFEPSTVTLSLKDSSNAFINLDPANFNILNVLKSNSGPNGVVTGPGPLYDLVHIGACGTPFNANSTTYDCSPGAPATSSPGNSIWVGSTGPGTPPPPHFR